LMFSTVTEVEALSKVEAECESFQREWQKEEAERIRLQLKCIQLELKVPRSDEKLVMPIHAKPSTNTPAAAKAVFPDNDARAWRRVSDADDGDGLFPDPRDEYMLVMDDNPLYRKRRTLRIPIPLVVTLRASRRYGWVIWHNLARKTCIHAYAHTPTRSLGP